MKLNTPKVLAKLDELVNLLAHEILTTREIAGKLPISISTLKFYLPHLRAERKVHIDHYKQVGHGYAAVYRAGDKDDAPFRPEFMVASKPPVLCNFNAPKRMESKVDSAVATPFVARRDWAASWIPNRSAT